MKHYIVCYDPDSEYAGKYLAKAGLPHLSRDAIGAIPHKFTTQDNAVRAATAHGMSCYTVRETPDRDALCDVVAPLGYAPVTLPRGEVFWRRFNESLGRGQYELYDVKVSLSASDTVLVVLESIYSEDAHRTFDSLDGAHQFLTALQAHVSNWGAVSQFEGWMS